MTPELNVLMTSDSYKTSHHRMIPKGTKRMYGNCTPRSYKYLEGAEYAIAFGQQMTIKWLKDEFDKFFANENAITELKEYLSEHLMTDYDVSHFQKLHDLGYLPLEFKSLPEGSKVPAKVPVLTFWNTHDDFPWLPLFLETPVSNMFWKPMTTATIAHMYRKNVDEWVEKTDIDCPIKDFMIHDFSSRGMGSVMCSMTSGTAFLTSSMGTDNLPALYGAKRYYNSGVCGHSVFASEHSVSSACIGVMGERGMIEYYMDQFPTGILSIVSDTLDLTKVVKPEKGGYLFDLQDRIKERDGKLVIRPDSSPDPLTPVEMICGYDGELNERMLEADYPEFYKKGLIECLWDIFGGTVNDQGYRVLSDKIGAIYGEAINLERQVQIYENLAKKKFASSNVVMGIGSYTLNMNSRDTLGIALKATHCEIVDVDIDIFKDPITDDGTKKSAKGLLRVDELDGVLTLSDKQTWETEGGLLTTLMRDGVIMKETTIQEVRDRIYPK